MTSIHDTSRRHEPALHGLLNLYKPAGKSSAQYVYRLRPVLGVRKIGHAGTLDPFADGVLIACIGSATKLVERLMGLPKTYRTTLRMGVTNNSFDPEEPFEPAPGAVAPAEAAVQEVLRRFVGEIEQVPPSFSAVKIGGVASYHLARRGQAPQAKARKVRIDAIAVISYSWPAITLEIRCGRGTYIRAIARDLGVALGCGACCETLTRTAIGPFKINDSLHLESADHEQVLNALLPMQTAQALLDHAGG